MNQAICFEGPVGSTDQCTFQLEGDGSRAFFDGRAGKTIDVPLYRRINIEPGARVPGPAIIAEDETSTFITASFDARIDAAGCIVMERRV